MKNKKFLFLSLLILAIGFAAVSTTLYISGNLVFGTNKNDFEVYFSGAIIDDEDKSNEVILSDKKHIEYETKELKTLGDTSVLEFEITNNSTQYDANVTITCTSTTIDYYEIIIYPINMIVESGKAKIGKIKVSLKKNSTKIIEDNIVCTLNANAVERTSIGDAISGNNDYQIVGDVTDKDGNILANKKFVVYSETPHYVTTDDYGFFYVNGLERGSHEVYYMGDVDASLLTKDEVKEQAISTANITTSSKSINFDNIDFYNFEVSLVTNEEVEINLDANGSSVEDDKIVVNKYTRFSNIKNPEKLPYYVFKGWYDGDKLITNNTIIKSDTNLVAKWEQFIWNYSYKGSYDTFTATKTGTYKLEVWGAFSTNGEYGGGYTVGEVDLVKDQTLIIAVGGKGGAGSGYGGNGTAGAGGWNGGGNGSNGSGSLPSGGKYQGGSGGGGATSIQLSLIGDGQLKNYSSNKDKVLIVAGGAGATGGCGYTPGEPGNGSGGGFFGMAGSPPVCTTEGAGGGGGGYTGGRAGLANIWSTSSNSYGGTGYIGGVKNGKIVKGNLQMPSPTSLTETITGNFDNGYARITLISLD